MINTIQYVLIILISIGVLSILLMTYLLLKNLIFMIKAIKMLSVNYKSLTDVLHKMFTKMGEEK